MCVCVRVGVVGTWQVYGQTVVSAAHLSDVWRAHILLKYGGVYLDTDAVIVRPIPDRLRAYDAVVSYDWVDWDQPFPDTLNLGIAVAKPGARFWQLCLVATVLSCSSVSAPFVCGGKIRSRN